MRYGSVCSGIEAASCAWEPLGWEPAWFSEIEPFPSAVLAHHYPNVKNLGDFTQIGEEHGPIDLLVGGTPCQAFSVAGARKGLDDPRGNLTIEFARLAARLRPRWLVWENVPGVLSIDGGRTFGTFLGMLGELGYGFAYRVLDAQYFGVPQRRRRVFVVGYLGDWRRAAAVLFERESLSGHPAPRREKRQSTPRGFEVDPGSNRFIDTAPTLDARAKDGPIRNQLGAGVFEHRRWEGKTSEVSVSPTVESRWGTGGNNMPFVLGGEDNERGSENSLIGANNHGLRAVDTALSAKNQRLDGDGETFVLQHAQIGRKPQAGPQRKGWQKDVAFTLDSRSAADAVTQPLYYSHDYNQDRIYSTEGIAPAHTAQDSNRARSFRSGMIVRRLTCEECEALQGFPRGWTDVLFKGKPAADGPRYRAIGNSMAVPVMRWIGQRIQMVEDILD